MRYQQDLQVAVRERQRRVLTEHWDTAAHQVRLVADWIGKQATLRALLAEAERVEPDVDFDAFLASLGSQRFSWPTQTEEGRITLVWRLMQQFADMDRTGNGDRVVLEYGVFVNSNGDLNDQWHEIADRILTPLFDFLAERVGAESSVLYVLERYVARVEWFDRNDLYAKFEDATVGEEVYNLDLQRFLFMEGNYTTHAKSRSASGEADLIGGLDTDDPLICEGKIFDGAGRGKRYIAGGFHQVVKYAGDYNKNVDYLVVFNMTDRLLQFPSDGPAGTWPPYVEMFGVRVYFVGVRTLPPTQPPVRQARQRPSESPMTISSTLTRRMMMKAKWHNDALGPARAQQRSTATDCTKQDREGPRQPT